MNLYISFYRLSIVDTNAKISQPFERDGVLCLCNGEIFNYKELIEKHSLYLKTYSDCEVILSLYEKMNIFDLYKELDGDFAFVIIDFNKNKMIFSRDLIGVRPLFYSTEESSISISSETKGLFPFQDTVQVLPNSIYIYKNSEIYYIKVINYEKNFIHKYKDESIIKEVIKNSLINSTKKRLLCSEKPYGFLLSGGLDSSLVLAIASRITPKDVVLNAFTIGITGDKSPDIECSREVVSYINNYCGYEKVKHHIISFTPQEGTDEIKNIIKILETYDVTTVRASIPMYLLVRYIKTNFKDIKVLFSGEGSDELFGGYLYFYYSPSDLEFETETQRLVKNLYLYDVCRADRCVSSNGLELRVPFLDKEFVSNVMNISPEYKRPVRNVQIEKKILRDSFVGYLPDNILYRTKAAFSDAVGKSWLDVVREWCVNKNPIRKRKTIEEDVFSEIYRKMYKNRDLIQMWVPKEEWVDTKGESSARVLVESN